VMALPAVASLDPDPRTRRVHHDWLEAGEHTQRTVAQLSQQLRRFLDDKVFQENRRILELLRSVESRALAVRMAPPPAGLMAIDELHADVELPMERPLHSPVQKIRLADLNPIDGTSDIDPARLFSQVVVDKERLRASVVRALRGRPQVTLREVLEAAPLQQGLAELVAYLELAHGDRDAPAGLRALVDDRVVEPVRWDTETPAGDMVTREARLPRVIFVR